MRFAYIDSQGNEVPIPSVDALALRIELGAIGPDTELYDAQADRWAPAEAHEIFHTLSRDVAGEGFLVPAPPPTQDEPPGPSEGDVPPPAPERATPDATGELGLTLAPPVAAAPDGDAGPAAPDTGPAGLAGSGGAAPEPPSLDFDLTGPPDPEPGTAPPAPAEPSAGRPGSGTGQEPGGDAASGGDDAFGTFAPEEPSGGWGLEPPMEFGGVAPGGAEAPEPPDPFGAGEPLESDLVFGIGSSGDVDLPGPTTPPGGSELDLEPPLSAFDPSGPPAWMEQEGPAGMATEDDPALDFSEPVPPPVVPTGPAPSGPTQPWPQAERRPVRRPPRSRRRRGPGLVRPLLTLALLGGIAAGGWYGWRAWGPLLRAEETRPPVILPPIPAELEEPMRSLAAEAIPAMYADIEAAALGEAVPAEPSEDWLAGVYLSNASRFAEVETFWRGFRRFADLLAEREAAEFHASMVALAEPSSFDAEARAAMIARADSGFLATREARLESYRLLGRLADASLSLHAFLVENEASIAYTPATAFSGNPVEEAVPATDEVGDRMWALVENITNAMDALGTLDRITRERLSGVLLRRIEETGIR